MIGSLAAASAVVRSSSRPSARSSCLACCSAFLAARARAVFSVVSARSSRSAFCEPLAELDVLLVLRVVAATARPFLVGDVDTPYDHSRRPQSPDSSQLDDSDRIFSRRPPVISWNDMTRLPATGLRMAATAVGAVTGAGPQQRERRVWSRQGRAHVEVKGLTGHGERHRRLAEGGAGAPRTLEGGPRAGGNAATPHGLGDFGGGG